MTACGNYATETNFFFFWATIGPSRAPPRRTTAEDVLEILVKFETVFIVDDSTSMEGGRWEEVRNRIIETFESGIGLFFPSFPAGQKRFSYIGRPRWTVRRRWDRCLLLE